MPNWFKQLFGGKPSSTQSGADAEERLLSLERDLQSLRLELADRNQAVATLKGDLENERQRVIGHTSEAMQAQMEQLMAEMAGPVVQILIQAQLAEDQEREIQPRALLITAKQVLGVLEDHGMGINGKPGDRLGYDPNFHQPANEELVLRPGDRVVVRWSGVTYAGKVIRKAGVAPLS